MDIVDGGGVNGSVGVTVGQYIQTWTAHEFSWADGEFTGAVFQADFKTDGFGHFDDDRVGWMISNASNDSSDIFGVQLDPGGDGASGYNIEGYWDAVTADNARPSLVNLPALSNDAWYQLEVAVTKLTATSAELDVEFWSLTGAGARDTLLASRYDFDTSTLGTAEAPNAKYFGTALYPAYKNYTAAGANADNFGAEILPEPATMTLLGIGGMLVLRRRRHN